MKNVESLITTCENISFWAHSGQTTRDGKPYYLHPLSVAEIVDPLGLKPIHRMVALLHDVIEDTEWTAFHLTENGVPMVVVDAVVAISKVDGESYDRYIERVLDNYYSAGVKIADMTHNMILERLPSISVKDMRKNRKYRIKRKLIMKHVRENYADW